MKKKPKLIPVDRERCQAEWTKYSPFIMGGNVNESGRCENKPVYISREKRPAADGLIGSMSLCEECLQKMIKQLGADYATHTPIHAKPSKNPRSQKQAAPKKAKGHARHARNVRNLSLPGGVFVCLPTALLE